MSGIARRKIDIGERSGRLTVVAGPCALESFDLGLEAALTMKEICASLGFGYIFKASFDKANRTSITSNRGPGIDRGLEELSEIGRRADVPVLTDIHEPWQAARAAEHVDVLQIPAFLCRQTDLLVAASRTGLPINVKKAQFMAPSDMASVIKKCTDSGASSVIVCERGTAFGYHDLVVDMRGIAQMRGLGVPVMFDATHSVQRPGGMGTSSGGDSRLALPLARAAAAAGIDALFMETHPDPSRAVCDGPNMIPLSEAKDFLTQIKAIDEAARKIGLISI